MAGEWIPIMGVLGTAATIIAYFYYNAQSKDKLQKTLRAAIDKGQPLSEDLLRTLAGPSTGFRDLRKAVILIAFGLAIGIFGTIVDGGITEVSAVGLFPGLVGVGYLVVWRLGKSENS